MIWLTYKVFEDKYREEKFDSFQCPMEVNPLLFSQLCLYHYADISKEHDYGVQSVYHQADKKNISPKKLAHLTKKSPTIFCWERWVDRSSYNRHQTAAYLHSQEFYYH